MTRFQLVFRTSAGDLSEIRDNSLSGHPLVDGVEILDGVIFALRGARWLATRDDQAGMARFICTPVPNEDDQSEESSDARTRISSSE
jgi:hypothetical protein